jgi:hypothetical protein
VTITAYSNEKMSAANATSDGDKMVVPSAGAVIQASMKL